MASLPVAAVLGALAPLPIGRWPRTMAEADAQFWLFPLEFHPRRLPLRSEFLNIWYANSGRPLNPFHAMVSLATGRSSATLPYEQAAAIVAEGLRRGTRRHRSVALGVAAQFELTPRQVDVIGTWEKLDQAEAVQASAVVERGRIWRSGLRFEDFAAGRLDVETSKTSTQAVYDVTAHPLFQQALAAVPASERMEPLVTDERGRPVTRRYYLALYRDVADAAGVPRAVWNMHARHGGATEAQEAGVALQDIAERTPTSTRRASTTLSRRSRRHVGSPSSASRTDRQSGTKRENAISHTFPTGRAKCLVQLGGFEPPTS
jgi:hypothetical protein